MAKKTKGGKGAASSASEGNLMAISSNNLAVLRDGKESVFDVVKRIPTTSSLSVSDDVISGGGKGGKDKSSSSSTVPLVGATPQQVRVALYNRALLYIKMKNVTACLDTLSVLRSSLHVSYHEDENKKDVPQSPKKSKGKKKKGAAAAAGDNVIPTAKPASDAEILAWEARADLLESELYRISESKDKSYEDILNGTIDKLDKALLEEGDTNGVLEFTKAQLLLHKAMVNNNPSSSKDVQPLIDALDFLPSSIKSRPGVIATLTSLHASLNKESSSEQLLSSLGNTIPAKLAMAEYKMDQGQYDEAVELLQGIVDEGSGGIEATALLVKALSYTDPTKAEEYVEELQLAMEGVVSGGGDVMDGEALESMDIPRFAKKELSSNSTSGSSTKVRKMIAATGGKGRSNMG